MTRAFSVAIILFPDAITDFWFSNPVRVKLKQNGKVDFFEKNLRKQFDRVLDSESNGGIFDSLAPFSGELWRFEFLNLVEFA